MIDLKKLKVIWKAIFITFLMVISNLKIYHKLNIYSRKTRGKKGKKAFFLTIFRVKINLIQKTVSHLERYFLELSDPVFRLKKFVLVHALLMKN